jgi:hypothetical protein
MGAASWRVRLRESIIENGDAAYNTVGGGEDGPILVSPGESRFTDRLGRDRRRGR